MFHYIIYYIFYYIYILFFIFYILYILYLIFYIIYYIFFYYIYNVSFFIFHISNNGGSTVFSCMVCSRGGNDFNVLPPYHLFSAAVILLWGPRDTSCSGRCPRPLSAQELQQEMLGLCEELASANRLAETACEEGTMPPVNMLQDIASWDASGA
jgi:hypothetical protein